MLTYADRTTAARRHKNPLKRAVCNSGRRPCRSMLKKSDRSARPSVHQVSRNVVFAIERCGVVRRSCLEF